MLQIQNVKHMILYTNSFLHNQILQSGVIWYITYNNNKLLRKKIVRNLFVFTVCKWYIFLNNIHGVLSLKQSVIKYTLTIAPTIKEWYGIHLQPTKTESASF